MPRQLEYTDEIGRRICDLIAEGKSMREIARMDDMPTGPAIYKWLKRVSEFADMYAKACEVRADLMFDEILEIADDATNDFMEAERGPVFNAEHVQRSRLRIDARKWALAKMVPKKYGDKLDVAHSGGITVVVSEDDAKL